MSELRPAYQAHMPLDITRSYNAPPMLKLVCLPHSTNPYFTMLEQGCYHALCVRNQCSDASYDHGVKVLLLFATFMHLIAHFMQ